MGFLSSIGSALGSVVDGTFGIISQNSANAKNKRQWQRERSWEEEKMRNAHQWEAEDLKAAGLNPTLTAGGSGAVGSGSPHAEMGAGSFGNFGKDFISNMGTIETLQQQREVNESQAFKNTMDAILTGKNAGVVDKRLKNETRDSLSRASEAQTNRMRAKTDEKRAEAEIEERTTQASLNTILKVAQEIENDFNNDEYIKALKKINATIDTFGNATGTVGRAVTQIFIPLKAASSAKEGLTLLKDFKDKGVFDILSFYGNENKKRKSKK